jgi:uncharacterized protein YceK
MKFIVVFIMALGLVGCGAICKDAPPRKAEYIQGGGYDMAYHFKLYDVQGDGGAMAGRGCTKYSYITTDLYSDNLGNVTADSIVWIDLRGNVAYPLEQKNQMKIYLSKNKIVISGHTGDYAYLNGEYPVR